jgi:hypothetical protein
MIFLPQMRDGVGVVGKQDYLPGCRPVGTTIPQNEVPQDKGPQTDLDRIIQAPPGKINPGAGFPELFDEFFDFRFELGLAVRPLRILDEHR